MLLLILVLGVGIGNLVVSLRNAHEPREAAMDLTAEGLKDLALKFEKQDLADSAAGAWRDYLALARISPDERAKVWYRIGKLYQEKGNYERALDGFYRSESLARVDDLAPEIARRTQESLEAMGKFAALQNDLVGRVGLDNASAASGDDVVAQIGTRKMTKADLDKEIEAQVDRQMAQFAAYYPPEELNKQKENFLKRLSSGSERLRMLNQLVAEELLYRRARESKLAEDPGTQSVLKDAERKILAQKLVEKELASQIKITPGDVETYYEANKTQYVQPERAKVAVIVVKDQAAADKVLAALKAGQAFDALAKEHSLDEATKAKGGQVEGYVDRTTGVPGVGRSDELMAAIFATAAGKVAEKAVKTEKGFLVVQVTAREPERQKAFDEVRNEAYQALRRRKESEVQQNLLTELKNQYNVVIYNNKFADPATDKDEEKK